MKVSVIIPCYNVEPYVRQCLQSVCAQTYQDLEILCINDGSTDSTLQIIQDQTREDSRVTVIDTCNEGYGASVNRGLDAATGDYIALVESDDFIEFDMFERMLAHAARFNEEPDIIKTPYWRVLPSGERQLVDYGGAAKGVNQPFSAQDVPALIGWHPSIWSALYRRQFLQGNNIRFVEAPGAGWVDNPFLLDTLLRARSIVYLDRAFYCYRAESDDKTADFYTNHWRVAFDRYNEMMQIIRLLGVSDEGLLRQHYWRGIYYIEHTIKYNGVDNPAIREAVLSLLVQMKPARVLEGLTISSTVKTLLAEV